MPKTNIFFPILLVFLSAILIFIFRKEPWFIFIPLIFIFFKSTQFFSIRLERKINRLTCEKEKDCSNFLE
ncbi:MAG: hypothetical protein PHZ25_01890 [Candidatus Pacebacteria bacterium]|nr:hypothetical protein [Candidatus Paceibacterota bacterium]